MTFVLSTYKASLVIILSNVETPIGNVFIIPQLFRLKLCLANQECVDGIVKQRLFDNVVFCKDEKALIFLELKYVDIT